MMKDKHFYWEIPSSIDLEDFLKKNPPNFKYNIDHFYLIIEYLCKAMDLEDIDETAGFINLNAQILQSKVHNYKKYLNHLLDNGFIRTDMRYVVGKKSKGFLINSYRSHKAFTELIPIKTFITKRNRTIEKNHFENSLRETSKKYPYLTKWFNEKLQINKDEAMKKVEELFPEQTGGIRGPIKGKPSIWNKRYKAVLAIDKIANKEFYYSVDDNVGRFHSNLTNIKKELRNYITYDGQKLVNIDIKNSQPLFSLLLLDLEFYKEKKGQITISNIPTSKQLLSNSKQSYPTTIIMLVKLIEKIDNQDIKNYIDIVNSGKFYEQVSKLINPYDNFDKQKIKQMIFTVFFSNNRFIGQPEAQSKRDFKDAFPSVYKIFNQLKVKNHAALAHILQRIESEIIIQKVTKRIAAEKPDLPIFTIHDSVATTVGNEEYVSKIIKEEVLKLTGLNVQLGFEYWDY